MNRIFGILPLVNIHLGNHCLLCVALIIILPWLCCCADVTSTSVHANQNATSHNIESQPVAKLKEAIKQNPRDGEAWFSLGKAYFQKREFEPAIESFQKAIGLKLAAEHKKEAHDKLGWCYYKMGEYDRAIRIFDKAIKLYPGCNAPLLGKACSLRQKGLYDQSIKAFNQILVDHPLDLIALDNRGWSYYLMKNYELALADFSRVETLSQNKTSLRSNVLSGQGWCYYMKGNFEKALSLFNEAMKMAPPDYPYGVWDAYRGMAFSQAALGNFKISYNLISKAEAALSYDPKHDLALLHYIAGDKKAAWHYLGQEGYIGLSIQPISINGQDILYVAEVDADGPAQKAGMLPGDIITALGETTDPDLSSFDKKLKSLKPGTKLSITVLRKGLKKEITILVAPADPLLLHDPLLAPIRASSNHRQIK